MAHKDPAARAKYQAEYRANNKAKIRAKINKWRKENPEASKTQSRRTRKNARDREALAAVRAATPSVNLPALRLLDRATQAARQIVNYGYAGRLTPGGF